MNKIMMKRRRRR